ncbi:AAA family ATPase [Streptomyces tendae]|uniref:helix-turn-helix transcriptional regulator n=1 Tax=Streptomyces tendae TaxID=1932 RepID=UPI003D751CCA
MGSNPTMLELRPDTVWDASTAPCAALPLVGRDLERARLRQLLVSTVSGQGAALVVRGTLPGIGKTALLEHAAQAAVGHRVVRLQGSASEADLPYSAVHLLCTALADELMQLGQPRREALQTAVGLRAGPAPDRMVVCVAALELLSLAARTQPLLCLVDDVQWLDEASAHVFAFVARRVTPVRVALLFADRGDRLGGLPCLTLARLNHTDARKLLRATLPSSMEEAVVERIVAEARGNPLVLLDSVRGASPVQLGGGYGVVASHPAEDAAVASLAPDSGLLLLLAAAEPLGDPARLWRAAARLGVAPQAAESLEMAGLVSFGPWVTFRDPRLRWSVYGQASPAERRRVHDVLARTTDPVTEPDRHLWHLAHSLAGPDDGVGARLARCAGAARERGGLAAEAAFLERATVCTVTPSLRTERAITAAQVCHAAGAVDAAVRLLAVAELGPVDASNRARMKRLCARMAFDRTRDRASVTRLLESAEELDACAPSLATGAYLEALAAATFTGHLDLFRTILPELARRQPRGAGRLLESVALRCTDGYTAAVEPLRFTLKTLEQNHEEEPRSRLLACLIAADLWDDDTWHEVTRIEVERARAVGARAVLPYVLAHRALVKIQTGCLATGQALLDESRAMADAGGMPSFVPLEALLGAWRGREHPAVSRPGPAGGEGGAVSAAVTKYASAVLHNARGAYEEAVAATRDVLDSDSLELQGLLLGELIEAAARCGEADTASAALERLRERTCLSGTDWALGVQARSRALLHEGTGAEALYIEAIERLGRSRIRTDLARAQLVYGEWLRRQGRRIDARALLRTAHASFLHMGADAFADRAMREVLATGERARRRVPQTRSHLTPQEWRIASLARDGRSNPEIATALSISSRTVEYHLHKVFTKLSITSRTELHLVLSSAETA